MKFKAGDIIQRPGNFRYSSLGIIKRANRDHDGDTYSIKWMGVPVVCGYDSDQIDPDHEITHLTPDFSKTVAISNGNVSLIVPKMVIADNYAINSMDYSLHFRAMMEDPDHMISYYRKFMILSQVSDFAIDIIDKLDCDICDFDYASYALDQSHTYNYG